ncbi:MAG: TIGR00730 family Rossman fold protein [Cytophagales bacterium]|nr:TIGR00730 family Rossman fold protein [Cytophagales bacterium]
MTNLAPTISLAVYCGSRSGNHFAYQEAAIAVGHWVGERGGQIVYGGGKTGLMGIVANAALDAGAQVIGVIPKSLVAREHANTRCTELIIVDTMHERKAIMAERANAFLAMAGGIGTFEEIIEQWVWLQLGYHSKPIGFLNTRGYYDTFLQAMHHAMDEGFMSESQIDLLKHGDNVQNLLAHIYPNR